MNTLYQQGLEYEKSKDYKNAYDCYKKAADSGHIKASTNAAYLTLFGRGTPQNTEDAIALLTHASNEGHSRATLNLACIYELEKYVKMDLNEALRLYKIVADRRDADEEYALKKIQEVKEKMHTYTCVFPPGFKFGVV